MSEEKNFCVLIVDDEQPIVDLFRMWLSDTPYVVAFVNSSEEALEFLEVNDCNIIITDVMMPGISGIELLKKVKEKHKDIQVIVVTGHGNVEMAVDALKYGASDFLQKPVEKVKFDEAVKRAVYNYNATRHDETEDSEDFTKIIKIVKPGKKIGNYYLGNLIGFGSQGAVYFAHTGDKDFKYAIKIQQLLSKTPEMRIIMDRFKNEVAALKKVNHSNIIKLIDSGYESQGATDIFYMVTEYFDGKPLDDFFGTTEAEFPAEAKVEIIYQVAKALIEIHKHGYTHRDIKPSNILVDSNFNIKLTDFGVCKIPDSGVTAMNKIIGTPLFLPPEYIAGGEIGPKLDIYSLGIVSYMMFLNITPFAAETYNDLIYKIVNEYPIEPKKIYPHFSTELQHVIGKMLNKKPNRRYDTPQEICHDLENISLNDHSPMGFFRALKDRITDGKVWQ